MDAFTIFGLQLVATLVTFALVARWYAWPWLARLPRATAFVPLLLVHTLRPIGLTLLVPAVVDPALPRSFSESVGYGDLIASGLAFLAIAGLRLRWPFAVALVWLMNLEGGVDLLNALAQGATSNLTKYQLGAAWFIPTYLVPLLLVTHVLMFVLLVRGEPATVAARAHAA